MTKDGMLVDHKGMTLYTFDKDADGKSVCKDQCATNWPPLKAESTDTKTGDWTVITATTRPASGRTKASLSIPTRTTRKPVTRPVMARVAFGTSSNPD